jgi:hypothetical protein
MIGQFFRRAFSISLFLVCNVLGARDLSGQTSPEQLIGGARREGKLVWYATLTAADSRTLLKLFEQKYRFIKTTHYGANSERMLNRIFTEGNAGQNLFDLVNAETRSSDPGGNLIDLSVHGFLDWQPIEKDRQG